MLDSKERIYDVSVDPATGLYDRRTMWSRLAEEVSRARRYHYPLSLILITLGAAEPRQAEGQVVQFTKTLKQHTRSVDILARYSEDSLALLLPCTDETGALRLAERIRLLALSTQLTNSEEHQPAKVSIGVTSAPEDYRGDKIALVEQVEWALRQTRAGSGEDIVVVPVPGEVTPPSEEKPT